MSMDLILKCLRNRSSSRGSVEKCYERSRSRGRFEGIEGFVTILGEGVLRNRLRSNNTECSHEWFTMNAILIIMFACCGRNAGSLERPHLYYFQSRDSSPR